MTIKPYNAKHGTSAFFLYLFFVLLLDISFKTQKQFFNREKASRKCKGYTKIKLQKQIKSTQKSLKLITLKNFTHLIILPQTIIIL